MYTGTGKELLLGYARAFVFVILPFYAVTFAAGMMGQRAPVITVAFSAVAWFSVLYLTGVAMYSSWRYRLSRTIWRGIRFGLAGSPWKYGGQFLLELGNALIALA